MVELEKKLLYLYSKQTEEERELDYTIENNSMGFNGVDAQFGSSLAKWILQGRKLTPKQRAAAERIVPKYKRQFENGEWMHTVVPDPERTQTEPKAHNPVHKLDIEDGKLIFYPATYPSKQVRTIFPFNWDSKRKAWIQSIAVAEASTVQSIQKMFPEPFELTERLQKFLQPKVVKLPDSVQQHPKLFPFQKEVVSFMLQNEKVLVGLAPGLGKTACAIFGAHSAHIHLDRAPKVLVVSPLSLVHNWKNEIKYWTGKTAHIAYGTTQPEPEVMWNITNYDTLRLRSENFSAVKWDIIIVDESILVKNRKAQRTKSVKHLVTQSGAPYVWLLSGAPTSKLYDDMWAQLNILNPYRFSSYWRFAGQYCYVEQNQWGWQIIANRPDADTRIKEDLQDAYIARTQDQVLDLPDWIFDNVEIPMERMQEKMYIQMEEEFLANLPDGDIVLAPNVLSQLTRLVQIASNPVLIGGVNQSAKWKAVEELLEYETLPAIVWTSFIRTAEHLETQLSKKYRVAVLTGKTKQDDRQKIVDAFQNGELDVIIAHPGVGKYGFTLTAARTAVYLERNYNADDYYQSLHRVRRIGTVYSPHVIHLISVRKDGQHTVDSIIDKVLESRKNSITKLTSGEIRGLFRK